MYYQSCCDCFRCYCIFIGVIKIAILSEMIIKESIRNGFLGSVNDLQILDLRNGYTPKEVANLLKTWGFAGRLFYLIIEAIDMVFYHAGYRTLFLILSNNLAAYCIKYFPSVSFIKWFGVFPILLSRIDLFEDCAQVSCVVLFDKFSDIWDLVVQCSSLINRTKWFAVRVGSSHVCLLSHYLVFFNPSFATMRKLSNISSLLR